MNLGRVSGVGLATRRSWLIELDLMAGPAMVGGAWLQRQLLGQLCRPARLRIEPLGPSSTLQRWPPGLGCLQWSARLQGCFMAAARVLQPTCSATRSGGLGLRHVLLSLVHVKVHKAYRSS